MCVSKMQSSQATTRTTMRRTIKRSFLLCASLVITPPKHTNTIISSSSVNTVYTQLQHISHASTGKQHHSSHTCLIACLTLARPLPPYATSLFLAAFLENDRPTLPQCRLRLSKLECKCKWRAHRNQSVSGNLQVVMECNDNGRQICQKPNYEI